MTIDTTARMGLTKDSTDEEYDVGRVNANTQKIDDNIGVIICTSSTRPSTPYNGMHIYETDTGMHGIWRTASSAWVIPRAAMLGTSTRPTLGIYAGFAIWRTDRGWMEVYDGAAWRVQGLAVVSSVANLSQITDPITGQQARVSAAPAKMYQWTGSAWEAIASLVRPVTRSVIRSGIIITADATEKTITELNLSFPVVSGENYLFEIDFVGYGGSLAPITWGQWRIRKTTALTGALVRDGFWEWTTEIIGTSFRVNWQANETNSNLPFFLSVQRNGGASGIYDLVGDGRMRFKVSQVVDSVTYVT